MSARVLIVDDDAEVATTLANMLETAGYRTATSYRGLDALSRLSREHFDLVLVDLGLPDMGGLEIIRRLDGRQDLGLIVITGQLDRADRIAGLELGADDYMTKPFDSRELLARVRCVLRRVVKDGEIGPKHRFGGWTLNTNMRELRRAEGARVPLTPTEFRLLSILASHPNRVLSRDLIMDLLYSRGADAPFDRSIDVTITRLRRKIEPDPAQPLFIKTVRGEGYLFEPSGAQSAAMARLA